MELGVVKVVPFSMAEHPSDIMGVGAILGCWDMVGTSEGVVDGAELGGRLVDGVMVGLRLGAEDGFEVGAAVGEEDGTSVGSALGELDG